MAEIDELDRYRAAYTLFSKLQKAEERAEKEGWIDADDLEKATEEIALTMQNSVVEENASATNFVATDLVQDLFGPRYLRKKASRPLNLL